MEVRQGRKGYFLGCTMYGKTKCKGTREVTPALLEQLQKGEGEGDKPASED
jgi:hypothetical protein